MKWKMPEVTEWSKEMNAHEPTRSYGEELYSVAKKFCKGKEVEALEIGCAWGVSALALLMGGVSHLTSVDSDSTNKAIDEIEANGLNDKWTFRGMLSEQFWRDVVGEYDLVYIDGSHKFPTCYEDLLEGWERLRPGGILIADDFTHRANMAVDDDGTVEYGVSFAVCNLIKEKRIKRIDSTTRLFIAYK